MKQTETLTMFVMLDEIIGEACKAFMQGIY